MIKKILNKWFGTLFLWLERCENEFEFKNLKGYETTRLYVFLAERYLFFWIKNILSKNNSFGCLLKNKHNHSKLKYNSEKDIMGIY